MELSYGHVLTLDKAAKLGVLDASEGLKREGADKPWEMLTPSDVPATQKTDKGEKMGAERFLGHVLNGMGPGLLSGIGEAMVDDDAAKDAAKKGMAQPSNYDHGGKVNKTGIATVHKGEEVLTPEKSVSLHRALTHLNKGGLHRALGVPEGESIPKEKIAAAMNSKNQHVRHMAAFAHTMGGFKK